MMSDLTIELLRLTFANGAGHEHRIEPITRRAAAILAERLDERLAREPAAAPASADHLEVPALRVSLAAMCDDEVAHGIANAWLAALAPAPEWAARAGGAEGGDSWPR
jgi:hypothetical protein